MWLYFNNNGAMTTSLEHGTPARVGSINDFSIFAYFQGLDLTNYTQVTLSLENPAGTIVSNDAIIGTKSTKEFDVLDGETYVHPFIDGNSYTGYFFDDFYTTIDSTSTSLFTVAGLWKGTIKLKNASSIKVQGTFTFEVQSSVLASSTAESNITASEYAALIQTVNERVAYADSYYCRVLTNLIYSFTASETYPYLQEGVMVFDKTTKRYWYVYERNETEKTISYGSYDFITDLVKFNGGRFLAFWNAQTGYPDRAPFSTVDSQAFTIGDYYIISKKDLASDYPTYDSTATYNTGDRCKYGGNYYVCEEDSVSGEWDSSKWTRHEGIFNYKPSGSTYTGTIGEITSDNISVGDIYYYKSANTWQLIHLSSEVNWGGIGGTLSNQTDLQTALNAKQDTLTFDTTPTSGSTNPVTSGGIKSYIDETEGIMRSTNPTGTGYFSLNRASSSTVGTNSFAAGTNNIASGNASHSEGGSTRAIGDYSHSEGGSTRAIGDYSHAEGFENETGGRAQHVFGEYSDSDYVSTQDPGDRSTYVEIVGNGTSTARSNARTLDWSGNEILAGTIEPKGGIKYLTTAPTSANTGGGLIFVLLSSEPTTKYDGYIYLIEE